MKKARIQYVLAFSIYGTIGILLHYISLPVEIVVLCRGLIGSLTVFLYAKLTKKRIHIIAIKRNLKYLIISGIAP